MRESEQLDFFEILARQNESMLLAYISSLVEDEALAEDIAQETFLIAYNRISTLKDRNAFAAWLRGIARYEIYSAFKKQSREIAFEPAVMEGMENLFQQLEDRQQAHSWQERLQLVENCYQRLPETFKTICRLHYFERITSREIAEGLRMKQPAVLKRLERIRDQLRECVLKNLEGSEMPEFSHHEA